MAFKSEIDPNGGKIVLHKIVIAEAKEEGRFANPLVADNDNLEGIVVFLNHMVI